MRGIGLALFVSLFALSAAQQASVQEVVTSAQTFFASIAGQADGVVLTSFAPEDPAWKSLVQAAGVGETGLVVLAEQCPALSVGNKRVFRLGGKAAGTVGIIRLGAQTLFAKGGRGGSTLQVISIGDPAGIVYASLLRQTGLANVVTNLDSIPRCP